MGKQIASETTVMQHLRIKRIYDAPASDDGTRVLVDRLWPRGVRKATAAVDLWLRDIAPSDGLRRWFNHRVDRWGEFQTRYRRELASNPAVAEIEALDARQITLLYAAKDKDHNHARVLMAFLRRED